MRGSPEWSSPAPWVKELTELIIGGAPVEVGRRYLHPEDGPVEITRGQYWGTHGLSNHWHWTVLTTGESKCGYGDQWRDITDLSELAIDQIINPPPPEPEPKRGLFGRTKR